MAALLPLSLINDGIAACTTVTSSQRAFIAMTHIIHSNRVRRSDALERVRIPHSVLQLFLDHTHDTDYARNYDGHCQDDIDCGIARIGYDIANDIHHVTLN